MPFTDIRSAEQGHAGVIPPHRPAPRGGRERGGELLSPGRIVEAAEGKGPGLVSRVVAQGDLLPAAPELAAAIAANPPLAIAKLKQGLRLALDPDWDVLGRWVSA